MLPVKKTKKQKTTSKSTSILDFTDAGTTLGIKPVLIRYGSNLGTVMQWYLVISDPFITDFSYNGHDFVRYFFRFCPLYQNFHYKIRKISLFYVFGPKSGQNADYYIMDNLV